MFFIDNLFPFLGLIIICWYERYKIIQQIQYGYFVIVRYLKFYVHQFYKKYTNKNNNNNDNDNKNNNSLLKTDKNIIAENQIKQKKIWKEDEYDIKLQKMLINYWINLDHLWSILRDNTGTYDINTKKKEINIFHHQYFPNLKWTNQQLENIIDCITKPKFTKSDIKTILNIVINDMDSLSILSYTNSNMNNKNIVETMYNNDTDNDIDFKKYAERINNESVSLLHENKLLLFEILSFVNLTECEMNQYLNDITYDKLYELKQILQNINNIMPTNIHEDITILDYPYFVCSYLHEYFNPLFTIKYIPIRDIENIMMKYDTKTNKFRFYCDNKKYQPQHIQYAAKHFSITFHCAPLCAINQTICPIPQEIINKYNINVNNIPSFIQCHGCENFRSLKILQSIPKFVKSFTYAQFKLAQMNSNILPMSSTFSSSNF